MAVIGLSSRDNVYSPFVATYLNFISPLRFSLLWGAKTLVSTFGFDSSLKDNYTLVLANGNSVRMVYTCIGYGVMSFWAAFVLANRGGVVRKLAWVTGGLLALWTINVLRVTLLLLASKKATAPFGLDHHTWFNITAYALIFFMIFLYDRSFRKIGVDSETRNANQNIQALS